MSGNPNIVWSPQAGPQKALIDCPLPEIFFGGARGGGKTDGVLGKFGLKAGRYGPGFNGIFFRRELPMLDDAIERSHEIYRPLGAAWLDQKKTWRFPNGARLRFRPLEKASDAQKYQGQNVTDACIEEVGQYPDPRPIDMLHGVLRSARGVPTQLLMTGNPGGPGQQWLKARYVDPAPLGMSVIRRELPNGKVHKAVFIPSRVQNNRILLANDPDYISRLHLVGSAELVRAWLEGDWNAIEGAFFDCWGTQHVIPPFEVPADWLRFRSFDWGYAAPFSVGWWAIVPDTFRTGGLTLPRGFMLRYREWYGASRPGVGLRLTAEEVAEGILARESGEKVRYGVADPAIFAEDGGPSIGERMARKKVIWRKADNKRVGGMGAVAGWDHVRHRLKHDMIGAFATCTDSIRTIPALQHDEDRPEDLDTTAEDHAADEWRYACASRPWVPAKVAPSKPRDRYDDAFDSGSGASWKTM